MKLSLGKIFPIPESELLATSNLLKTYIGRLKDVLKEKNYDSLESSISLSTDPTLVEEVLRLSNKKKSSDLKYIIVIGIGGSNLGTKAVYDALYGYFDHLESARFPKIIFLDTQEPEILQRVGALIKSMDNKNEFIINAISKSGGTTETMVNLEIVYALASEKFGDVRDRVVVTTDSGSKFHSKAMEMGLDCLFIPKNVGGRYSVLSSVGLFPLSLMNIDIKKLGEGAQKMRDICVGEPDLRNPALLSASVIYQMYEQGKNINDNFIFAPQLESLGKWYRQLMGESIGKNGKGPTPTVSIGSTDLHSVTQLYLGGPKDKITTFMSIEKSTSDVTVPDTLVFDMVHEISSKDVSSVMSAMVSATKIAYEKQARPYMEVVIEDISEGEIGAYMQFKMIEMMFLGKLFGVNPFDQPHVELYKIETKRILSVK